jgi:hypothetical protein
MMETKKVVLLGKGPRDRTGLRAVPPGKRQTCLRGYGIRNILVFSCYISRKDTGNVDEKKIRRSGDGKKDK